MDLLFLFFYVFLKLINALEPALLMNFLSDIQSVAQDSLIDIFPLFKELFFSFLIIHNFLVIEIIIII